MFGFIWRMPWFVYVALALVAVGIGYVAHQDTLKTNEARKAALEGQAPEIIDVVTLTRDSFTDANEINVSAQIIAEAIFTVSVSGRRTVDRDAHVLFALSPAAEDTKAEVKAAFLVDTKYSIDQFFTKFSSANSGAVSPIFNVNGMRESSGGKFGRTVKEAAEQANLTFSQDIEFIEPFMEGREAGLQPRSETSAIGIFGFLALGLLLYGGIRYLIKRKKSGGEPAQEA